MIFNIETEEFILKNSLDSYYIAFIEIKKKISFFSLSLGWQMALNTYRI